ncbi:MAG: response regulator [Chitinophagales bacterium]
MDIRILVYEDNDDLRDSLTALLRGTPGFELAGAFPNCSEVEEQVAELIPDVVLMDIDMPMVNGIEGLKIIRQTSPQTHVIMLTVFDDDSSVFEAITLGASGYLLKRTPPAKLLDAIAEVLDGGAPMTPAIARKVIELFKKEKNSPSKNHFDLTDRELEVLKLIVDGNSVKLIANDLSLSEDAVKSRIKKIYEKLHVHNMGEAVAKAFRNRLVE